VAIDLVRAEAARALHLLRAVRVLRGDVNAGRRPVYPRAVLQHETRRFVATLPLERLREALHLLVREEMGIGVAGRGDAQCARWILAGSRRAR